MTDVLSSHDQWSRRTMPGISPPKSSPRTVSRLVNDLSSRNILRRITLYRNGDRYFTGKQVNITPQKYSNLRHLLQELSSTIDLPYGVRRLFTPRTGSEITDIKVLKDGASYVCASFEPFQKLEYKSLHTPQVTFHLETVRQPLHDLQPTQRVNVRHLPAIPLAKVSGTNGPTPAHRFQANNLFLQSLTATNSVPQQKKISFKPNKYGVEISHSKPRTITIVKQGSEKPHRMITILLNRRTAQTFDQLLSDISEAFGYQKHRTDKIRRLFTLKGRQVNGINDFFREDDVFIASTNFNDIPATDLREITLEILNDSQHSPSRRSLVKQSPIDHDPSSLQMPSAGLMTIDIKKTTNIRDSGFLDDEDGFSGADSELVASRVLHTKRNGSVSEDVPTPNDLNNRRMKKTLKQLPMLTVEQQRERERQRLREEEERRKRFLVKKDHHYPQQQQPLPITSVPKFEQLVVDRHNEETSRPSKTKTPSSVVSKPITNTSIPRLTASISDEGKQTPKKLLVKTRSTIIHPSPAIVTDKYEFGRKMGDGNFAIVRRSKIRTSDREVAIKIIDKSKMKGKEYMLDHEINIMYMCNHPNVIRLFEDYETADEIYLVMELIKGGDLFDYITKHRRFDEPTSALMIKDVSEALMYLHAKNIVHRDLKPENLLVMQRKDGRITIKLTDFGLAMHVTGPIKTVCGTPTYVAPEILAETGYGVEVDCWATGIILYILLCGYPPFKTANRNQEELFQLIQRGKFSYESDYWNSISTTAKNLLDQLLVVDRHKRIRAEDILIHPWILSVGQSKALRNTEELKTTLRAKYEAKMEEYAMESNSP